MSVALTYDMDEVMELLKELRGVQTDLRRQTNRELRAAAGECAQGLVPALHAHAANSPTPQARIVAESAKVKSDRLPVVTVGGSRRVGHRGTQAGVLVWGSERGGHNFVAGAGGEYWITPAVQDFQDGPAGGIYMRAVGRIFLDHGIV